MWNVNPDRDNSRGGFQNSDVGRTEFNHDFGPEYGIDYARFADTPDIQKDLMLLGEIEKQLAIMDFYRDRSLIVRNGFVILKGTVPDERARNDLEEFVRSFPGVVEVINQVRDEPGPK